MLNELLEKGQITLNNTTHEPESIIEELNDYLTDLDLRAVFNYDKTKILLISTKQVENNDDKTYILLNKFLEEFETLTLKDIYDLIEYGIVSRKEYTGDVSMINITKDNFNDLYELDASFMAHNTQELLDSFDCFNKCKYCNYIVRGIYHRSCLDKFERFENTQR
ncbi:hypothetical protein CDIK_2354 [Cucumispora dikerogammari]|nr:hypothetical protein CDIK_2354 [Cucumispora dikerogammari]